MTSRGRTVGFVERAVVRNLGIATQAVQLHGRASGDDRYWLQLRAFDKQTDPGRLDTLTGGLVANAEILEQTLERETQEEAGLSISTLLNVECRGCFTLRRPVEDGGSYGFMVETVYAWHCVIPEAVKPCNLDGEVAQFVMLSDAQIDDAILQGEITLEAAVAIALCRGYAG
nr:NUDIX domain-containing protein [Pseudomonas sp. MWU16-30317]